MTSQLPNDLYCRIFALGQFSFPHRNLPQQREAKINLHRVLTQGAINELPEALRRHGYAWVKDINGRYIQGENWTTDTAYQLAGEVEMMLKTSTMKRAA